DRDAAPALSPAGRARRGGGRSDRHPLRRCRPARPALGRHRDRRGGPRGVTAMPETRADYRYGWYTAAVLMVAYTFSFLDRQILNLMVGPIKADLHLTDTQFALLTGGAFGLFYTAMGLPIAWLADRYPRTRIIA